MSRTVPGYTWRHAMYSVPFLSVASAVRQHGQASPMSTRTRGAHVLPPSVERVIHAADASCPVPCMLWLMPDISPICAIDPALESGLSASDLPSQETKTVPFAATCSAWKLCDPKIAPSVTVTGALHVFPPSCDDTRRRAERGKRSPGTTLPMVYAANRPPSGAYASLGGASPC